MHYSRLLYDFHNQYHLFLFLSFSATAQEETHAYWTIGGGLLTFDDGFDSIEPIQVFGRLGYDFNANIGIGVEGSFSLIEDEKRNTIK